MDQVKFEDLTQEQKDNLLKTMIMVAGSNNPNGKSIDFNTKFIKYGAQAFDDTVIILTADNQITFVK